MAPQPLRDHKTRESTVFKVIKGFMVLKMPGTYCKLYTTRDDGDDLPKDSDVYRLQQDAFFVSGVPRVFTFFMGC